MDCSGEKRERTAGKDEGTISKLGILTFFCVFFIMAVEGIDLSTLAVSLSVIMKDFHLNSVQGGMIFSISTAGMMVGGIVCGWLADRFGRLRVTQLATLTFVIFICLSTLTRSFLLYSVIRFVSSAGMSGAWASGVVMVSEYIPTDKRNTALGMIQGANAAGSVLSSLLNGAITPIYGWRPVVLLAAVCGALALFITRFLKEPPSFAAYKQRKEQQAKSKGSLFILLSDRQCRRNLLKWTGGSIFLMGGYYAANSWLPTYMTEAFGVDFHTMTYFIAGNYAMMFVGRLTAGILSDKFGRKKIWIAACAAAAAILPLIIKFALPASIGYMLLLFGLLYGAPMALCSTFMSESFPTSCRGTGTALAYNGGRIGSMVSTILIGAIAADSGSYGTGFLLIAVFYLACGLMIVPIKEKQFDPETAE